MSNNDIFENILTSEDVERKPGFNPNLTNSILRLIGDKITICQVIQLLAFIRHAIKENKPTEINVKLCHNISGGEFLFDVNQQEIPDFINKESIEIN